MKAIHKIGRHYATIGTKLRFIWLMLTKKKIDTYYINFDDTCRQETYGFSKILGTSKGLNPRRCSYRLAWRYQKENDMFEIRKMYETKEGIKWENVGKFTGKGTIAVQFEKKFFLAINTPYFGGHEVPDRNMIYYVK